MRSKILTIPNALTVLRGLGIPLFAFLALSAQQDLWAILVLTLAGASDYFDGKLARAWGQESRLGELMDPAIDRLYIGAVLIVLYLRHAIPLWIILLLLGRDLFLGVLTLRMKSKGIAPLSVTFLGKAATFNLLYAFPFLLLAQSTRWWGSVAFAVGWSFAIWGVLLYLITAFDYFRTGWRFLAHAK